MEIRAMEVGVLNPLQLPIGKDVLRAIVTDAITAIEENRPPVQLPDDHFETELLLSQRREFLLWLDAYPHRDVDMALYPLEQVRPAWGLLH